MKTTSPLFKAVSAVFLALAVAGMLAFALKGSSAKSAQEGLMRSDVRPSLPPSSRHQDAEEKPPVLVELFTSEGCSSCPPADRVLAELARSQNEGGAEIIPLEEHVDYWNHLGWRDPFSSAQFSQRQSDYARVFNHDGVYTPQMIVDGHSEFVGSNMATARQEIARASGTKKVPIKLTIAPMGAKSYKLHVETGRIVGTAPTSLWLAITEDDLSSSVDAGENSGSRLKHTALVRKLEILRTGVKPDGQELTMDHELTADAGWNLNKLDFVVFLQSPRSLQVFGAARIRAN
ncbi:MAG TPA: DUF1223 domain-containing protein [Blastocatellia bacterium]|nr:DUF1223 domain-containing protein [Blastocatellia bacterium]